MHDQYDFPAKIEKESDGNVVTFPDVPEAITQGSTIEENVIMAQDALRMALDGYNYDHLKLPISSQSSNCYTMISLRYLVKTKLAIYQLMTEENVSRAELCSKLHCDLLQIS